jgi:hypothetical protein
VMAAVLVNMFVTDLLQSLSALGLVIVGAIVYLLVFWEKAADGKLPAVPASSDAIREGDPPIRPNADRR